MDLCNSKALLLLLGLTALVGYCNAFSSLPARTSIALKPLMKPRTITTTSLHAMLTDPMLLSSITDPSPLAIQQAFSAATFFPQPFWLFLIFLPNTTFTKKLMGGMEIVTLNCLIHFFIVVTSIGEPGATAPLQEFSGVFDPSGNPQQAFLGMMQYPNFVSEEWSHVLTWDLFVGRWIWLDGLKRGIFTSHSVLLCNLIGPPGLLLHWATCLISGKGLLVQNELEDV